jgi:hypothetical protein
VIPGSQFTVVIPTYRRPKFLAQALESVVAQNLPDLKVSVFDNASGDDTRAVVEAVQRRIPIEYVCHAENLGAMRNIQASLASVKTPYCALLGDDDLQMPKFLATALERLEKFPAASAFCGRTVVYDDVGRRAFRVQGSGWQAGFYRAGEATRRMVDEHFTFTGVAFKTEALRSLPFDGGDMEFMARFSERYDFVVGEELTAVWRLHQGSWSRQHAVAEERRVALARLRAYLELRSLDPDEQYRVMLRTARELAHQSFQAGLQQTLHRAEGAPSAHELRSAAGLLLSLDEGQLGWTDKLLLRGARLSAGNVRLLHAVAAGSARLARWARHEKIGEGERASLQWIDEIAARASRWYR